MSAFGGTEPFAPPEDGGGGGGGDDDGDDDGGGGTTSTTTSPGADPSTADDPFAGPEGGAGGETETFDPDTDGGTGGTDTGGGGTTGGGGFPSGGGDDDGASSGGGGAGDDSTPTGDGAPTGDGSTEMDTGEEDSDGLTPEEQRAVENRRAGTLGGSMDPAFRPDLFRDPAQQVHVRERIEQQLLARMGRAGEAGIINLETGEVDFEGLFNEEGSLIGVTGSVSGRDAFDVGDVLLPEGERRLVEAREAAAEEQSDPTSFVSSQRDGGFQVRRQGTGQTVLAGGGGATVIGGFEDEVATRADLQAIEDFRRELDTREEHPSGFTVTAIRDFSRDIDLGVEAGTFFDVEAAREAVAEGQGTELTQEEQLELVTQPLTSFVEDVEQGLGLNIPGEGPVVRPTGGERDGETRLEQFLAQGTERITEGAQTFVSQLQPAPDEDLPPDVVEDVEAFEETPGGKFGEAGVVSLAASPAFLTEGAGFLIDVGQFQQDVLSQAIDADIEGVEETFEEGGQAVVNVAATGAASAIDEPFAFGGAAAGSLLGSTVLFGAAAAVGPRTSLATRALIQPGEEAAGIGGFSATRAISPRAAERLFPGTGRLNREPLILSEEAFLRGVRSRAASLEARAAATRDVATGRRPIGPSPRQAELIERFRPEGTVSGKDPTLPKDRPDLLTARMIERRDADPVPSTSEAESMIMFSGPIPVPIRRPRPRSRGEVLGGGASETVREEMVRQQIAERRSFGGDFEGEFDPVGESEVESGREFDTEMRRVMEAQAEFERRETAIFGPSERLISGEGIGLDPLSEIGSDVDLDVDVDLDTDIETEFRIDRRQRPRFDRPPAERIRLTGRFEFPQFEPSETEKETEPEVERPPREVEVETDPSDKRLRRLSAEGLALQSTFEKRFTSPVASPAAVLSGLSKDVLDDS